MSELFQILRAFDGATGVLALAGVIWIERRLRRVEERIAAATAELAILVGSYRVRDDPTDPRGPESTL